MKTDTHNAVVVKQYNPRAHAYLSSAVHASGADLDLMATLVGHQLEAVALDSGSGAGHVAFRLAGAVGKVVAYDLSSSMLETVMAEAQKRGLNNIVPQQGAVEALPYDSASFDIVASRYSAHHWHAFEEGLRQMRRVMKPDGMAIFMDVVSPGQRLLDTWLQAVELLRDPSHVRNASLQEWQTALSSAGFEVGQVSKYRVRLEFAPWIERMKTPQAHVAAIRSLQQMASTAVTDYFEIEADGSFTVDTVLIAAQAG